MSRKMASKLALNSTRKLNSGYEIPLLGFGVCCIVLILRLHANSDV
jgi:hypothetical protein